MKTRLLFLAIFLSFAFLSFGQRNLSGSYYEIEKVDEDDIFPKREMYLTKIEIKDSSFKYIFPSSDSPVYFDDTLAICNFKWVDDNFIEINSVPPNMVAEKGLKVTKFKDLTVADSIKVTFLIPYVGFDLNISVYTRNPFRLYELKYFENNQSLMIAANAKRFTFSIKPEAIFSHTPEGRYYGVLFYTTFESYTIQGNVNHIQIEIPGIDNSFFEKYYVNGDYAKVSGDTITWKGVVYIKRDNGW